MADGKIEVLKQAILDFDEGEAKEAAQAVIDAGISPMEGINAWVMP